ncbi:MAG: hypothetical protein PHE33_04110 [Bacteroidales bacterium]|nr:hypothetical protein [Bacteroidales bacterium]
MNKILNIVIIAAILAGVVVFNYSCKPEDPPKAVVTVVDEDNKPVEEARVIVRAANSDSEHTVVYLLNESKPVADTQLTDAEGKVYYDFKYESIYKIEVTKQADRQHLFARRGVGVLILENNKTYETKIEVNEQTVFE